VYIASWKEGLKEAEVKIPLVKEGYLCVGALIWSEVTATGWRLSTSRLMSKLGRQGALIVAGSIERYLAGRGATAPEK
jgi:hypothetical protein